MGQEFSSCLVYREIKQCIAVNAVFSLFSSPSSGSGSADHFAVHVLVGPHVLEEVTRQRYFLLSHQVAQEENSELFGSSQQLATVKLMDRQQFLKLKGLVAELHRLHVLGADMNHAGQEQIISEECPICMEHSIDIALPCGHSFCTKCFQDWKSQNPTCPFCRMGIAPLGNLDECWRIENPENMNEISRKIHQKILGFAYSLLPAPKKILNTHKVFPPISPIFEFHDLTSDLTEWTLVDRINLNLSDLP